MAKRKHKKRLSPVMCVGERATPERCHQLGGVMTEIVPATEGKPSIKRQRVRIENVLDIMFRYRVNPLSEAQYTAGLKFYEIFNRVRNGAQFKVLCNPFMMESKGHDAEWKMLSHIHSSRHLVDAYKILTEEEQEIVRKICGHDQFPQGKREHRLIRIVLDKLAYLWGYK